MIPQAFIQDLLNRVDVVEVIDRYVPLKRAGANYKACCPFHSEKTPSFTVSPSKQFYHCFGCGAHGSAIGFLMEYRGLGFVDAVRELAAGVGMNVPEAERPGLRPPAGEAAELYSVLERATRFYRESLKRSPQAIAYLKGRGLSGEVAARFGIGYAPADWQALAECFDDYGSVWLEKAGLVLRGEGGRRYDRFRDRIMFPIADSRGRIVGFGGRLIGEGEPKYLNSPETPIFEKGRELYGLFQARGPIREAGRVLVVEGYMDVVALAQHGIGYACATLGTATTGAQAQKLLRQADRVVFCFDGDEAGRRAAWRALEAVLPHMTDGKEVSFLFLPAGEDPDSLVRRIGGPGFEARVEGAVSLSAYLIEGLASQVELASDEGRARLLKEARPLVTRIQAPGLGFLVRRRLAERVGLTLSELEALYRIRSGTDSGGPAPRMPGRGAEVVSRCRRLIRQILFRPELALRLEPADIPASEPDAGFLLQFLDFVKANPTLKGSDIVPMAFLYFANTELDQVVSEAARAIDEWGPEFDAEAEFEGVVRGLREEARRQRLKELTSASLDRLSLEERQEYLDLLRKGPAERTAPQSA
ncbi:DNA primase [Pelomicrobium sp. G1]|uniref:DNA primase n=1 Tax=unclassified Pelomicrobium TaxID=2815318 RepID=UPI003F7574EC